VAVLGGADDSFERCLHRDPRTRLADLAEAPHELGGSDCLTALPLPSRRA
jgi:hypothetical protein